jgi:hypothetical protein
MEVEVKVKLSIYRPGQAIRTAGGWGPQNFPDTWYIKMTRLSTLDTCRIYIQEITLVLISVRD